MSTGSSGKAKRGRRRSRSAPRRGGEAVTAEVTQLFDHAYLNGVFLVLNAIPDAGMLFDGPPCGYDRTFLIHGTHDLMSRMLGARQDHRIWCTLAGPDSVIHDRSDVIHRLIGRMQASGRTSLIMLVSMLMASITGIDYEAIIAGATRKLGANVIRIPDRPQDADWLDGYDETLVGIARSLDLEKHTGGPRDVAVVGYLFDRNEGDHVGNIAELRRVLGELSLDPVSIWLDGSPLEGLARVQGASTILSLPYGRRAAREISARTGARVVDLDLPFGLGGSRRWLDALGRISGARAGAERLASRELETAVPLVDVVLGDHLLEKRFGFYGDTYLGEAVLSALTEVGCVADHAVIFGRRESIHNLGDRRMLEGVEARYCARYGDLLELDMDGVDFFVGNSYANYVRKARGIDRPFIEIGYPSYRHHCLTSRPFLFFGGFVDFLNRIVNQ